MAKKTDHTKIEIVSYHHNYLVIFINKLQEELFLKGTLKIMSLPIKRKLFSVLKSPFINKKAIEQFSLKSYKKIIFIPRINIEELKHFLRRVSLKNVAVKIKEYSLIR